MVRDLKYAFRSLRRSPGFVVVAIASLGLGLGLTTTMFSLLDAVTHPYEAYANGERLYSVRWMWDRRRVQLTSFEIYKVIAAGTTRSFEAIMPVAADREMVDDGTGSHQGFVARVPIQFLSVLGVRPDLGRSFQPGDEASDVAIVSRSFWKHALHSTRTLTGTTISLNERSYSIIGVMPYGMDYPAGTAAWLPISAAAERAGVGMDAVRGLARLRAGVSPALVRQELDILRHGFHETWPGRYPLWIGFAPIRSRPQALGPLHFAMAGGAIVVLLIACANLANLMLARTLSRRRDLALRLAIGARRGVVVRELFTECIMIAIAGSVLGALLSVWAAEIVSRQLPREIEGWLGIVEPQLSWRVFALSALVATASAVIFGVIPAIRVVSGVSLAEPLKDGAGTSTGRTRQRYSALVIAEGALALTLIMAAGVLTRQARALTGAEYNFAARSLVRAWVAAPHGDSASASDVATGEASLLARLRTIPGVVDATTERALVPSGKFVTAEADGESVRKLAMYEYLVVTPSYLRTVGLRVIEGRGFLDGDAASGRGVAILSKSVTERLYPHGSAVGHMVKLGGFSGLAPWVLVVGVAEDAATGGIDVHPRLYVARRQDARNGMTLLVRALKEDPTFAVAVRRETRGLGWYVAGGQVEPFLAGEMAAARALAFLAGLFATMAMFGLGLAAVGLYGVMAYAVSRRMREFGVRVALGARPKDTARLIGHDAVVMLLAGTALGGFTSMFANYVALRGVLLDVVPTDALTLIAAEAVIFAAGAAACIWPVLRASRANPLEILRAS